MKVYCLFLILIFTSNYAQKISLVGNSVKPFPYSEKIIDNSTYNIYYEVKFKKDPRNSKKIEEAICLLRLGDNYSMFSDYNSVRSDSLSEIYSHKTQISAKEFNLYNNFIEKWNIYVLKDFKQAKNIIQDYAKETYQYEDNKYKFDWKLENESKEILGYICHKATTEYKGRKYVAWYAKDIPINNGPYLFQDLPGLIMEIEDSKSNYYFKVIALDHKPGNIYLKTGKNILQTSREKFRQLQKNVHENPSIYSEPIYDSSGNQINIKMKSKPYNPIELE